MPAWPRDRSVEVDLSRNDRYVHASHDPDQSFPLLLLLLLSPMGVVWAMVILMLGKMRLVAVSIVDRNLFGIAKEETEESVAAAAATAVMIEPGASLGSGLGRVRNPFSQS